MRYHIRLHISYLLPIHKTSSSRHSHHRRSRQAAFLCRNGNLKTRNKHNHYNVIDIRYYRITYYIARQYKNRLFNTFKHTFSDLGIYDDSYPFQIHICV